MRHQDLMVYLLTRKVDVTTENQYSSTCLKCFKYCPNQNNKRGGREKKNKMQPDGKRNINVFNHRHIAIYVENPKEYTKIF